MERYVELLCREIRVFRVETVSAAVVVPERVNSVYFGGGTPSLLQPRQLQEIFAALRGEFVVDSAAEITLEAAPGQIGDEVLETALGCGVNRVSLGVQSFVDREAQAVGRSHTEASCRAEFARLRAAGVGNLGADLITGLPYQTAASWEQSLDVAVASGLDHLSVYMLEVDEESRLGREVLGGGARLHAPAVPSDDLTAELYEEACRRLPEGGFAQYEISNFSAPGRESKHNLKYWLRGPYLGFGLDAHSMLFGPSGEVRRWANADELGAYDGRSRVHSVEPLSRREAFEETVFLRLRLSEGMPWSALDAYPRVWVEEFRSVSKSLEAEGLLRVGNVRLWLTGRGRMISSEIFGELLAAVPV